MSRSSDAAHRTRRLCRARTIPGDDPREDQRTRPVTARFNGFLCALGVKSQVQISPADPRATSSSELSSRLLDPGRGHAKHLVQLGGEIGRILEPGRQAEYSVVCPLPVARQMRLIEAVGGLLEIGRVAV